jgi:protein arginine kinase
MTEIYEFIHEKLRELKLIPSMLLVDLSSMDTLGVQFLVERHLISRDLASSKGQRAVVFDKKETTSIMVNEEDHLRIQVIRSGLQLLEAWQEIDALDSRLEKVLPYAFSSEFGYLTACPTNVGTGMRISVMLHLPALVMTKQMEKVFHALSRLKYTVRGLYGEVTQALGDFYQISNQVSLGKGEKNMLNELQNIIPEIIKFERTWRERLYQEQDKRLEDRIQRAYGLLRCACTVSSEEAMDLFSAVRLGINLKLIKDISLKTLNELFICTQPAHLQRLEHRVLKPAERDVVRAQYIKNALKPSTG